MVDESGYELKDYKFYTFNGVVKALLIVTDRQSGNTKLDYFDAEYNHLPFTRGQPNSNKEIPKPKSFEEMKLLVEKLSEGLCEARVDFYDINGKIYFGEITFFPAGGFNPFEPEEWDYTLGSWIQLPKKNRIRGSLLIIPLIPLHKLPQPLLNTRFRLKSKVRD